MKVFKKVLFILLALSMVCCFVGCPDPNNGPDPDDGSDVVIDGDDSGNTGNEGGNVEGDTPVTPPAGDEGGDVEGDTPATVDYTANFLAISDGTAYTADTKLTIDPEKVYDTALLIYSPSERIRARANTNNLNYNGGTKEAFAVTNIGEKLEETLDRYVGVSVNHLATSGKVTVSFTGVAKTSEKGTDKLGQAVLIDDTSTILAAITNLDIDATGTAEGVTEFTLTATVDAASVKAVVLGFSRGGVGGGGIDITSITVKSAK